MYKIQSIPWGSIGCTMLIKQWVNLIVVYTFLQVFCPQSQPSVLSPQSSVVSSPFLRFRPSHCPEQTSSRARLNCPQLSSHNDTVTLSDSQKNRLLVLKQGGVSQPHNHNTLKYLFLNYLIISLITKRNQSIL